jgi:hypothetical protein|nr:MAG TPA: Head protein [Caudoviricetes sp.]
MPSIPKQQTLTANAPQVLNAIRANQNYDYQSRVPEATQGTLKQVGNAILSSFDLQNAFLNALVNRIALVLINSKMFYNPLRVFKKGTIEYGEIVEEIFVNIAKAHVYDPVVAEQEVFKREIPDVDAIFHKMNYKNFYKVTIQNEDLRQAFLSSQGISDLIARIVDSLYSGANYDEFLIMKNMIVDAVKNGRMATVTIPEATAENAKSIITTIKSVSNALEFPSTAYNAQGVLTYTPKDRQVLILDTKFDAINDVEVLASAFNMDKAEFMGRRVLIDNFADLTGVPAVLVDESWWMVFDMQINFTEIYNAQGLYWNYFYHVWKLFSESPYSNAVVFTSNPNSVTSVTVSPESANVAKGSTQQMAATVVTTGYAPKTVNWSVTGAQTPTSRISNTGLLTVATNEPNDTLTVTAVSAYDPDKSDTSTITVTA